MADRRDPFEELESLFDQFAALGDPLGGSIPVDVVDAGDELLVHADLPGRDPQHIDVQLLEDRKLQIDIARGERSADGRFLTRERTRDSASRIISLPAAVDEAETSASYDRGVLTVSLSKLGGDGDGTEIPVE